MKAATEGAPAGTPRIVAFPEAFALPLALWLSAPDSVLRARTLPEAAGRWMWLYRRRALAAAFSRRTLSPKLFYHIRAIDTWPLYESVFCEAARDFGCYVVAGSTFSPLIDREPSLGWHAASRDVYNVGLVVSPRGRPVARPRKHRLTPAERKAFLSPAPEPPCVIQTSVGPIAVLICLDGFQESLVERADAAGARILIQPSANNARWDSPWSADPGRTEGTAWLEEGIARVLRDREWLRLGINPMLTGEFCGIVFEGRSSIGSGGSFLRLAENCTGDDVLTWCGPIPADAQEP